MLFNRFLQPDIDLETLRRDPEPGPEHEQRAAPAAALDRHPPRPASTPRWRRPRASIPPQDVIKLLLAGADVTMIASALYQHGPDHVRTLLDGIRTWMMEKEYTPSTQMKGSLSLINAPDPAAFERANYIKTLVNFTGDRDQQLRTRGTVQ